VKTGNNGYEEGSANIVSSIVVNYRMFDTLGEILVLFASTAGVGLLLVSRKKTMIKDATSIAQTAVSIISLIAVVLGAFIILHGHLSPGGGFPGGAIVASALILMILILKSRINNKVFLLLESISGFAILGIGLAGFIYDKTFFENFLPTGTIGNLFSSGTVIVLYILIGIKVMSEIFSIGYYFLKKESS
jgi:multicomponent Na+:H+ antiporter subunit B